MSLLEKNSFWNRLRPFFTQIIIICEIPPHWYYHRNNGDVIETTFSVLLSFYIVCSTVSSICTGICQYHQRNKCIVIQTIIVKLDIEAAFTESKEQLDALSCCSGNVSKASMQWLGFGHRHDLSIISSQVFLTPSAVPILIKNYYGLTSRWKQRKKTSQRLLHLSMLFTEKLFSSKIANH